MFSNFSNTLFQVSTAVFLITLPIMKIGCTQADIENDRIWYSFEEAQQKVSGTNMKILLDIHDSACNSLLHEQVYPDSLVSDKLKKYFCSVSINADSEDSLLFNGTMITQEDLVAIMGVTSYPSLVFLDSDGEKIVVTNGQMEADTFAKVLSFIGSDAYLTTEFDLFSGP